MAINPNTPDMIRFIFIALTGLCSMTACFAQEDNARNLYFVKKDKETFFDRRDYLPDKNKAFYIYRNCVYNFVLKDKKVVPARVIDIRNDSIYYTLYPDGAAKSQSRLDTLALHPGALDKIRMTSNRLFGNYINYPLTDCRYVFVKGDTLKRFASRTTTSYSTDGSQSVMYELIPYMTAQGVNLLYEHRGVTYYYEGIAQRMDKDTVKVRKPPVIKKWAWFTPANVNKISGLNIGLQTMTLADNDSLVIEGVNLNVDLLSTFIIMHAFLGLTLPLHMSDTVDKTYMKSKIAGLSISGAGVIGDFRVCGLAINGVMSMVTEIHGVQMAGLVNVSQEFKGLLISGLYNASIKGRGLQISLFNWCKDFKGVQLGLWNVNKKRKLPLINWNF